MILHVTWLRSFGENSHKHLDAFNIGDAIDK